MFLNRILPGPDGPGFAIKSGFEAAGSFAGNPKTATITFSTAFSDATYIVVAIAEVSVGAGFVCSVETQIAASFDLNVGSNNIGNLTGVHWIAMEVGEF